MKTYNERREVARRLREAASYYESMERDVDFYPVESALGLKPTGETAYTPESVRSLADLIEPSGYECVPGECPLNVRHDNDRIDREAPLALADEMEGGFLLFGSTKSARRVFDFLSDKLGEYARRIREACGEAVGCDVCARCGAVIVAVPTADGERRCARCGGSDFFASTVDVDAPLFERDCYQLARCAECVNMWSAVRQYGRAPSALVLCPFLRGRAGIRLAPLVVAGAMADEECPFRRPASCVGDAELSELAMMGNSAAADELRLRGLPARCPLCGSVPTVERSTTGLAVGGRLALLSVRCGCGFEVCERMPFELFEAGEGVARAHMLDRALAKWNARAVAVPSLARIVRMLKEHTVE